VPSINDGLFAGRAGIQSHGSAISVLADNIANANTVGFKTSRPDFADLLAGNLGGGSAVSVGSGSSLIGVTQIFNQGTFEFTGRGLDLAIDGNGFYVVQDAGGGGQRLYSRAGNFRVDEEGNLLNQNGMYVLGFPENGAGGLEPLNVNERKLDSIGTANVTIAGNLNAASEELGVPPGANPTYADLNEYKDFSTFVDVFDSLGASHSITMYYFHTGANTWEARAYVDSGDIDGQVAGSPYLLGSATLNFEPDGTRTEPIPDVDILVDNPAWASGANPDDIEVLFNPFTQYAQASSISSIAQDGTGGGSVVSFTVEEDGTLFAQLDNGQTASIGTIALANFANVEGLRRVGNSLYAETGTSGEPVIGTPGNGTFGALEAGALELSTADIASDFIKLISLQRGFQGSSRVITNIDDLLNEIINLA